MKRIVLAGLILWVLFAPAVQANDDFQYWSELSLRPYKSEKLDFLIFSDFRFMNDAEQLGLYFFSPRLIYHYSNHLDFALNYTYLQSRNVFPSASDDSYNLQHRAEVEINPKWMLTDHLKLAIRNRAEFRWIEDRGADNVRYRQRWGLDYKVAQGSLASIYANSEFFYDSHLHEYSENRTVPLGLNFKVSDKVSFSLFYMIQSQKGAADWSSKEILGTLVSVDF